MSTIKSLDINSGALGKCYATIKGNRYLLMQLKKISAKVEINKKEFGVLGKTGKVNKPAGWKGTGSATMYYTTSIFRELIEEYKDSGKVVYFDIQIETEDPSSSAGKQTTLLLNCSVNSMTIAQLDVDSDGLEEDFDFTFEDFKMPNKYKILDGMAQ